jgi:multidrug resistance protein
VGGRPHALGRTFYEPTLLTGVTTEMLLAQEETFGPVAGILRFRDEADAVASPTTRRRAGRLLLRPRRSRAHLAGGRGARVRHGRHQHRARVDRGGALRRREGERHRPRGLGRRPVILGGLGVFALGNLLCLAAPTLEVLLAGRAVQSFGSAAGLVVARAMLGDLYAREKMARMLAYLTMVMVVGPTVAPLIGGAVTDAWGWQALFGVLLVANASVIGITWRWLPETRAAATAPAPWARCSASRSACSASARSSASPSRRA